MTSYLPPLNNNTEVFNVGDFNYQDSYISYYTGDQRYSKLNGMNTFSRLCFFNGGIYASSIFENGIDISLKYAPIDNANLTGTPTCSTANGAITNQIANVNFVNNSIANIQFPTNNLSNYVDLTSTQTITGIKTFGVGALSANDIFFNNIKASFLATQLGITTGITNSCLNFLVGLNSKINNNVNTLNNSISLKANIDSPSFTTQISTPILILNETDIEEIFVARKSLKCN